MLIPGGFMLQALQRQCTRADGRGIALETFLGPDTLLRRPYEADEMAMLEDAQNLIQVLPISGTFLAGPAGSSTSARGKTGGSR